jgi:hypothetical protein
VLSPVSSARPRQKIRPKLSREQKLTTFMNLQTVRRIDPVCHPPSSNASSFQQPATRTTTTTKIRMTTPRSHRLPPHHVPRPNLRLQSQPKPYPGLVRTSTPAILKAVPNPTPVPSAFKNTNALTPTIGPSLVPSKAVTRPSFERAT